MPDIYVSPIADEIKKTEEVSKPNEIEPSGGSLSAFVSYPENVRFETQQEDEQIIFLLRKHWITNLPWLFLFTILIMIPAFLLPLMINEKILAFLPLNYYLVITIGCYLVIFGFAFVKFLVWYFNIYLVTNERIVDVDFYNLLYKKLSSCRISKIQDITYKLGGVVRSLVDFGDVFIQTAGTENNFEFEAVPHPEKVVRVISDLIEHYEIKTYEK